MTVCNTHNEGEVCYESRDCPACTISDKKDKEIVELEEVIKYQRAKEQNKEDK